MQFFKLTSSMAFLSFIVGLAACSEGDQGTGRLTQMRCKQDGLCVEKVGSKSLEMGYRKGIYEVRADVVFRRYGRQIESNRPFSVRFLDQDGKAFVLASSGSNPDGWLQDNEFFQQNVRRSVEEDKEAFQIRNSLLQEMVDAMRQQGMPDWVDAGAWQEAEENAVSFLEHLTLPPDRGRGPLVTDTVHGQSVEGHRSHLLAHSPEEDGSLEGVGDLDVYDDEDVQDELDAHAEMSGFPDRNETVSPRLLGQGSTKMSQFGSFSGLKKQNINYTERHQDPRYEYTQELELWNLNTRTFFVAGWPSKKHHSSAKIWVYRRLVGSTGPWEEAAFAMTRNHGSRPGDKGMHKYARCTNLPVTRGYYNWKGECDGVWLTGHLCNDDTAYQVWHAYGGWNGGRHCVGKKRTKRPSCDKPW